MEKRSWIRELADTEILLEQSGAIHNTQRKDILLEESLDFLTEIKVEVIDVTASFNELKKTPASHIKLFDLSGSRADFMIFRNGHKLIFSIKDAGLVSIKYEFKEKNNEDLLEASWGAFGDIKWCYKDLEIKIEKLVHHYMTQFLTKSIKS